MAVAFLFGSPLQGMFEFGWFVFATAGIAGVFSLVFFALFLVVFGPEGQTGEVRLVSCLLLYVSPMRTQVHAKLRPVALDHVIRKKRASRVSTTKIGGINATSPSTTAL